MAPVCRVSQGPL